MVARLVRCAAGPFLALLLLAGCVEADPAPAESATATGGSSSPTPQSTTAAVSSFQPPEPAFVPFDDAPRKLTGLEQSLLREPGPYAGDAYDQAAVIAAARELNPSTPVQWSKAILAQIHGDYAEDVKTTVRFDPSIGANPDRPEEATPEAGQGAVGTNHFALVLDASGSMAASSGSGTRMEAAKAALTDFVGTLPPESTVSLRVYGHKGSNAAEDKKISCASSAVTYQGTADDEAFARNLSSLKPTGWTPLAAAIGDAAADIPSGTTDGIVYVVTDGIESCGGDPVAAAKRLGGSGIEPIINVIGFQTGDAGRQQLRAIAEAGGGDFTAVGSKAELEDFWDEEYSRMMDAWNKWQAEALVRINEQGNKKMDQASEVGQRIMDTADQVESRGMAISAALGENGMDYDTETKIWGFFYDRGRRIWSYGYDTSTENWSAAYDEQSTRWREVYDTGTGRWTEYYEKSTR